MSEPRELADALAKHFSHTQKLRKGGAALDYLSTYQVVTRLQDTLGLDGWEFEVREHGADDRGMWALGRLTVYLPTRTVTREQFGECALNSGMSPGDARKGAASDALKKCASLLGVGLYLARDEWEIAQERMAAQQAHRSAKAESSPIGGSGLPAAAGSGVGTHEAPPPSSGADSEGPAPRPANGRAPTVAESAPTPQDADAYDRLHNPLHPQHATKLHPTKDADGHWEWPAVPTGKLPPAWLEFEGGPNERSQQFITACAQYLNLTMGDIQTALGGKVGEFMAAEKARLQAASDEPVKYGYEHVYAVLHAKSQQDADDDADYSDNVRVLRSDLKPVTA